ncbi:RolB family protein [Bradyrhizobium sp. LA2.1]|uniref:RolB family protein n=1 Tax=Bradyrhizobium sp. LA2.1 TaxID=3156376 RepID=UPI0033926CEC
MLLDVEQRLQQMVVRYKSFLRDELLPAQIYFADILDASDGWRVNLDPDIMGDIIDDRLAEYRGYPCMNDPTDGILEQIMRDANGDPKMLYVLLAETIAASCADTQNLNVIAGTPYHFRDGEGKTRMLAYELPPYGAAFYRRLIMTKMASLGGGLVGQRYYGSCLVVPRTDFFRNEGEGFWSRPDFGDFDVVARVRADLDLR